MNFKEIDKNSVEFNGEIYTKDQNSLNHKLLQGMVDKICKIENDISFISSGKFNDFLFNISAGGTGFNPGIEISVNGVSSVACNRTAVLIEKTKAVLVKIVSMDNVDNEYVSFDSLTKDEKKEYKENGFIVIVKKVEKN